VPRPPPAKGELELGSQGGQGSSQLVARVRDEAALSRKGGLEAVEHAVQGLPEAVDLVARGRKREPTARLGRRDRLRLASHRLDRPKRGGGETVARKRREQERGGAADQQRQEQAPEGLPAVFQRRTDDYNDRSSARPDGLGEQSHGLVGAGDAAATDLDRPAFRAGDLGPGEERAPESGCRVDDRAARAEDLRERLSLSRARRSARAYQRPDVVCAGAKALIDRPVESAAQAQVEKQAGGREDDGHRNGEGKREAQPDRHRGEVAHDAHPPPSARSR
jgi:hypothetical protein